jgi:hypothetical protein
MEMILKDERRQRRNQRAESSDQRANNKELSRAEDKEQRGSVLVVAPISQSLSDALR